ncbi:PglZ domain protein [Clostridium homopropionicum DSM 5847]|uniref:PglZ domain protein n=1 Tax=Clostridium homopropionicum DSM 5847 TaxID=1121318 RepID=A0A0L6Z713_9CLOT|nr:PglZ domain-containing protein [Clostridium homopropionicum]KOA18750.1 PglZ domain protein [Clostridium homopropionicum DSM 5847]SFG54758.1 PglZ domain-containing protein [Clostridium homopropionicum]
MSKVILIEDFEKTYQEKYDVLVSKVNDYVDGYNSILNAIYQGLELVVVVRDKHCMNWLKKMQIQYLENRIKITKYSPKTNLQEIIGINIPDYVSDDDIAKDEFIPNADKFIFSKNLSFEDNLLNHYFGIYFTQEQFPFYNIFDLLNSMDFSLIDNIKKYRVLNKVYKNKLRQWNENCTNGIQENIISEFISNPSKLFDILSKYSVLKKYPISLQIIVIGDITKALNKINLKIDTFILDSIDIQELKSHIKLFLNDINITDLSQSEMIEYIDMLSGHLNEEAQFVRKLLDKNNSTINKSIINKIIDKFEGTNIFDSNFEEYLSNLIPPNYVLDPEKNNSIDDWINWAISSYLPYRFWMEDTDTFDLSIDKYSEKYGDWVFNNYSSLISSESKMIYKTMKNISSNLKTDNTSLIIMIDNFNYKYVNYSKELFSKEGFALTQNTPTLSMLPTATEVSKYAFFSGEPFESFDKKYSVLCKQWESMLEKRFKYLPDLNSLENTYEKDADVYILNYLSLDKVLHDNSKDSAIPLRQRIKAELSAMVDKVLAFIHRLGVDNLIKIYIISDHGSTRIISGQDNLIPEKFHKDKSDDAGYKYIKLDDSKFSIYKDGIGNLCYPMDKARYGVKYNYMIAKSYNRFLKINEDTYVHGGISPEEHIIPLLKFEKVNVTINRPTVGLKNNNFRFNTLANFVLEIKNFNDYEINNLSITILNDNIKVKDDVYAVGDIESYKSKEYIIGNARITNNKEVTQYLKLKLDYEFVGKKYSDTIILELNIKSIQESKFDLNDLF